MRPIRCFSCGELLGDKYEQFDAKVKQGEDPKKVLDELGLKRYCCRAAILGSIDVMEEIGRFKK
ncbi:MAG: DNA-directed RNA polymerase subunit N [Candidatus Hadarchaeota archaeon]